MIFGTLLYAATALLFAALTHRFVQPLTKTAVAVLILLPLFFTGPALLTGRVYAPIDLPFLDQPLRSFRADFGVKDPHNAILSDVYTLNIPWKYAARVAISHGEWPLWNPYVAAGDILAAGAQPAPYEPVFLISLLLPMALSLTFLATMTYFIGALWMFAFLREIGCSQWASLAGAATWTFNLFLVFYDDWNHGPTLVWLPLVILAVRRLVRTPGIGPMGILTAAFTMMLLNGHPESALHMVAIGVLWAACELWNVRFRTIRQATPLAIIAGVLALALTALFMLPIIEAIPQTSENRHRKEIYAKQSRGAPLNIVERNLLLQFVPFVTGEPQHGDDFKPDSSPVPFLAENGFAGSAALALAAIGLFRSRWRGRWLALAFVIGGLVIVIQLPPFGDLLAKLPLFDIALNERLVIGAAFGVAILAALGVDALVSTPALAVFGAYAALCAFLYPQMRAVGLSVAYTREKWILLLLPPLLIAIAAQFKQWKTVVGLALVAIIAGERALESADVNPTLSAKMFFPQIPITHDIPRGGEPHRMVAVGRMFIPNIATMYEMEDVRAYSAMTFLANYDYQPYWSERQPVFFNRVDDLTKPFLSLLNVKYAMREGYEPPPAGWSLVMSDRACQLLENHKALARAFIPRNVTIAGDAFSAYGKPFLNAPDYGERAWIVEPQAALHDEANGSGSLTVRYEGMNALAVNAQLDSNAWMVISEMAWKGWRAYVDGKPSKIRSADGMLLAVHVPAGKHEVRLVYLPHSFVVGRWISAMTMLLIAIAIALRIRSAR